MQTFTTRVSVHEITAQQLTWQLNNYTWAKDAQNDIAQHKIKLNTYTHTHISGQVLLQWYEFEI